MLLDEMVNDAIKTHVCADELVIVGNAEMFDRGRGYYRTNPFAQSGDFRLGLDGRAGDSEIFQMAEVGFRWFS